MLLLACERGASDQASLQETGQTEACGVQPATCRDQELQLSCQPAATGSSCLLTVYTYVCAASCTMQPLLNV